MKSRYGLILIGVSACLIVAFIWPATKTEVSGIIRHAIETKDESDNSSRVQVHSLNTINNEAQDREDSSENIDSSNDRKALYKTAAAIDIDIAKTTEMLSNLDLKNEVNSDNKTQHQKGKQLRQHLEYLQSKKRKLNLYLTSLNKG